MYKGGVIFRVKYFFQRKNWEHIHFKPIGE